jgi:hypothetical protein
VPEPPEPAETAAPKAPEADAPAPIATNGDDAEAAAREKEAV